MKRFSAGVVINEVACVLSFLLCAAPVFGAGISVHGDEHSYHIALFDPDAECRIEANGEAICTAGAYVVRATAERGCGDSFGPTYCASVAPGEARIGANEFACTSGKAYVLSAGLGEVRCKGDGSFMECVSVDGSSSAEASCLRGCGNVRGAGVCCIAGPDACPPGVSRSEEDRDER